MGPLVLTVLCALVAVARGEIKCESSAIDLVFVMDQSGSILNTDFELSLQAAADLVGKLTIGPSLQESRVGFVLFDEEAQVQFKLTDYTNGTEVAEKIKKLSATQGSTDIALGMRTAIEQVFTSDVERGVPKIMVLVTDGRDNTNVAEAQRLADAKNIKIFALGMGKDVDTDELRMATGDAKNVFLVETYSLLGAAMDKICTEVLPSVAPTVTTQPRPCDCDYKKTWLDLIFLVDSSKAVSTQDFNGVRNFLSSFARTIPISQSTGAYSRVGIINVGSQAQVVADLKKFPDSKSAATAFRSMVHLKDDSVNMFAGLVEAQNMIDADERLNVQNVVVIFTSNKISCAHYQKSKLQLKAIRTKLEEKDPCRIAAHLREAGNIVITVGMKFDGVGRYPDIDITSPCYSVNYDTSMALKFTQLMCKANCFCLKPYIQFKDDSKCEEYGECVYLQGTPLDFYAAQDTCDTYSTKLADVHSAEKERFLQDEHASMSYFPYWIGASKQNGVYHWETGSSLSSSDYTNWAPNQPDASVGECIAEDSDRFKKSWYSADCSDFLSQKFFSCQKNACGTNTYCEFDK